MPPDEEPPPYPGNSTQRMACERAIPTLSLQQQAGTKHVQVRSEGGVEDDEPVIPRLPPLRQVMRPRGKRLTPAQEKFLSARARGTC
ncbi:hypothetical protein PR002_g20760 [Phytophthora rubi]|uniref:Uncharacterized protein n=1 Tax=Phytophthora rubi TaxID=129364 RepID=A0A6A3JAK6_9STRA|nr:hypothetical protein PR002_g20760 [Phytophthora rubi]